MVEHLFHNVHLQQTFLNIKIEFLQFLMREVEIVYSTTTGTALETAQTIQRSAHRNHILCKLTNATNFSPATLTTPKTLIFVLAVINEGEVSNHIDKVPDIIHCFMADSSSCQNPETDLSQVRCFRMRRFELQKV